MTWLDRVDLFEIELSNYCNAKCPACDRAWVNEKYINNQHLSLSDIKRLVEQVDPNTKFYFGGTSGDPLMNPEFVDIFKFVTESNITLYVDTNASLRNTSDWEELGKISKGTNSSITFSIDGLEDTNSIYRVNTNWNKIINNLSTYLKAGGNAEWKYLIFDHNQHQLEEAKKLAKDLGVQSFLAEPSSRVLNSTVPIYKTRKHNENEQATSISCRSMNKKYMYISCDFKLYPCCYYYTNIHKGDKSDVVCDLNSMTLSDAIHHVKYKKLAESWNTNAPPVCKIYCNQNKYWDKIKWVS